MISFDSLLLVGAVAVAVPLALGLAPSVRVPAVVLEILGGVVVGPALLGWVHLDTAVRVTSDLGLGYLLFLAGFEIDLRLLEGRSLRVVGRAFVVSAALAAAVASVFQLGGLVVDGLLVAITLLATSLGVLVPLLKDRGETATAFGRLVMAAGSLGELVPLVALSVFFSARSENPGVELGLFAGFLALTAAVLAAAQRVRAWAPLRDAVGRMEHTSSQLRVRVAITLALAFGVVAEHFGLAMIMGAFLAGILVRHVGDTPEGHADFAGRLEAIGFGFPVPAFFVATGVGLDVRSLLHSERALVAVPVFVAALLLVRGLPALLYVGTLGRRRAAAAGLLQATSLPLVVVATAIGVSSGHLRPSTAAALVVAGLLSVVAFPPAAVRLMGGGPLGR